MREILEALLTREGYQVRLASSGEEGLELAKTIPFDARRTWWPSRVNSVSRISRMISSSSTIRMLPERFMRRSRNWRGRAPR